VVVAVGRLSLTGGAQISSGSGIAAGDRLVVGSGKGGTVAVAVTETAAFSGTESGLVTTTAGAGRGGNIRLRARQVQLTGGAVISAKSDGTGNAGDIHIIAADTFVSRDSAITTAAALASGGNIEVHAPTMVRLQHSTMTATVAGGAETAGGTITIDPEFVVLAGSQIIARANQGTGGDIRIQAGVFLADPASQVDASSTVGIDGSVDIRAPVTNLSGSLVPLPQRFVPATPLLRERCAQRLRSGQVSSFVVAGREGIPAEPGGVLPSSLVLPSQEAPETAAPVPLVAPTYVLHPGENGEPQRQAEYTVQFPQAALEPECTIWQYSGHLTGPRPLTPALSRPAGEGASAAPIDY
jgi:hypothetical protein